MFRDVVKSVAKNTSVMYLQQLVTWGSTFLLMLFLPRYLGPVDYGRYFLAMSIVGIFVLVPQYGGNFLVAKNVARVREDTAQIMIDALGFRVVFAAASYLGLVAFAYVADYPSEVRTLLFILGLLVFWGGGISVLYACYQGHELMRYTSAGTVAERVFIGLMGVTVILLGSGVVVFAVLVALGSFLNLVVLAIYAKRIVRTLPRFNRMNAVRQIRDGFPFFLFAIFSTIYYRIGSIMLSKMAPEYVIGWYGGAYRLFDTLNFFPYIFTVAVFPVLSRLWKQEDDVHRLTTQKSLEFMIIVGVLVSVGVIMFADKIIELFYGLSDYGPSVVILRILSAGLLFLYINMILGTTLMASDKQLHLSFLSLLMIPTNIALNFFLIEYFQSRNGNGGIGSAIATVITEFLVMISALWLMPQGIFKGFRISLVMKSVFAGCLMAGTVLLVRYLGAPWLAAMCVGPIVFAVSLFVLKTLEPHEEAFLRRVLSVRNIETLRSLFGRD